MAELRVIRRDIKKAYKRLKNWRAVGRAFGISAAMAWRISEQGYEPKDVDIRLRLGMTALGVAPVCEVCGEVHVSKVCPLKRKRRVRRLIDYPVGELRRMIEERVDV